jgi:phosphomannomutase/phosphoglucomutase
MSGIFRAYDIRGTYPAEVNKELAEKVGKAFGTLHKGTIVIAMDVRKSSPELKEALVKGLLSTGAKLIDVGAMSTPMCMWAVTQLKADAGIIVTASHNPPQYNGFKLYGKGGVPISYEDGIKDVEMLVSSGKFASGNGKLESTSIDHAYLDFLSVNFHARGTLKVVLDCINGGSSRAAPAMFQKLGMEVVPIRCGFDGDFPAEGPDPSRASVVEQLRKKVAEEKADLGFAYDGDGDRLTVVDETGTIIEPKAVFSMLIDHVAKEKPGAKVVYDALASQMVVDSIIKAGGVPLVCRVGHTYITNKMLDDGAALAGEISGHYYFKETNGADDALFASMKVLEYVLDKQKKVSELAGQFKGYVSGEMRVEIKPEEKFAFIEKLKDELCKEWKIDTLDGVKVFFGEGWALFRPSNTEPKISIAYEAKDRRSFEGVEAFVKWIVSRIPK